MKVTRPKSNNGTIVDNDVDFKIEFDPISDALAAIRNGESGATINRCSTNATNTS